MNDQSQGLAKRRERASHDVSLRPRAARAASTMIRMAPFAPTCQSGEMCMKVRSGEAASASVSAPMTAPIGRDAPADEFAAAEDDAGDREKRVAAADIRVGGGGDADQRQAGEDAEEAGEREHRHLDLQKRPAGPRDRDGVSAGAAQDRAVGGAHQPDMHDERDDDRRHDGEGDVRRLEAHQREQPVGRLAARSRQEEDREALPDEAHAERHHDRGQVAQVDQRAERGIDADAADQDDDAEERRVVQPRRRHAADEADEGADREIEVVARRG